MGSVGNSFHLTVESGDKYTVIVIAYTIEFFFVNKFKKTVSYRLHKTIAMNLFYQEVPTRFFTILAQFSPHMYDHAWNHANNV